MRVPCGESLLSGLGSARPTILLVRAPRGTEATVPALLKALGRTRESLLLPRTAVQCSVDYHRWPWAMEDPETEDPAPNGHLLVLSWTRRGPQGEDDMDDDPLDVKPVPSRSPRSWWSMWWPSWTPPTCSRRAGGQKPLPPSLLGRQRNLAAPAPAGHPAPGLDAADGVRQPRPQSGGSVRTPAGACAGRRARERESLRCVLQAVHEGWVLPDLHPSDLGDPAASGQHHPPARVGPAGQARAYGHPPCRSLVGETRWGRWGSVRGGAAPAPDVRAAIAGTLGGTVRAAAKEVRVRGYGAA